jgi:hypothetical protein
MTAPNSDLGLGSLRRPTPSLTFDDAVEVWKRYALSEKQHHIAQAFGVNQGRISEILNERRHVGSRLVALGPNPADRSDAPIQ